MRDLNRNRAAQEARQYAADVRHTTRYGEAIGRYLGSFGYGETAQSSARPAPRQTGAPAAGVVLVGVDDSPASYVALDHAAIEADVRGWDLRLLHMQYGGATLPAARDWGVVGRRGRGGVTSALLGSVSRSVIQHARCPVFLVG